MSEIEIERMKQQILALQKQRQEMFDDIKSIRTVLVVQSLILMAQIVGFFIAVINLG